MAKKIGIKLSTLGLWQKKYPVIKKAIENGRDFSDKEVEDAMFKKAKGFFVTETVLETKEGPQGITTNTREVKKYVPPDTTAQIFWLKNRNNHKWNDRRQVEHKGHIDTEVIINIIGDENED